MLVHVTLSILLNLITLNINLKAVVMYLLLITIFRTKYELNYAFQRSINEVHLFYDRVFKRLKFRNWYQKFYKFLVKVCFINDYNEGKRVIRY